MSRVSIGAVLVILSSAVASTSGCSVIGYTLGSALDRGGANSVPPSSTALTHARGKSIRVLTTDDRVVSGRMARVDVSAESTIVFAGPRPGGAFLSDPPPDSLRIPLTEIRTVTCPGSTMRSLFGGLGLASDIFVVLVGARGVGMGLVSY